MIKVLLLDTNIASLPIYEYLINSKYFVYVIGGNPNDYLAKISPNYLNLDYQNIAKVRFLIKKNGIKYIVPGCNDVSYNTASKLNSKNTFYGIDTLKSTNIINNKKYFRQFAIKNKLSVPKEYLIEDLKNLDKPIIIKPVDAYSGRGITIVNSLKKNIIKKAIHLSNSFSKSKASIIEEFVTGDLYSHSAFINNKKISLDFIVNEFCNKNKFTVDTSNVNYNFPPAILDSIRNEINLIVNKLNLVDGLMHTQFILNKNKFWIIEITRRCPGDLYSKLIETSTNINYAKIYTLPFLNKSNKEGSFILSRNKIIRHTISSSEDTNFKNLKFSFPVLIENYFPYLTSGEVLKKSPFGRVGLIFLKCNNKKEVNKLLNSIVSNKLYKI